MQKVIGITGLKGAGKDTAASILVKERGYRRIGFADELYAQAAAAYGVSVDYMNKRATKEKQLPKLRLSNCRDKAYVDCVLAHAGVAPHEKKAFLKAWRSPRFILQYWGTEYRRKGFTGIYAGVDSYWIDIVLDVIKQAPEQSFVITDVRFKNEVECVRGLNGSLVRVRRPTLEALEAINRAKGGTAAHSSETEMQAVAADFEAMNLEGEQSSFFRQVLDIDEKIREPQLA